MALTYDDVVVFFMERVNSFLGVRWREGPHFLGIWRRVGETGSRKRTGP